MTPTATPKRHRQLLDVEILIARTHWVALISDQMRLDRQTWIFDDDDARRVAAQRVAFARWCFQRGVLSEVTDVAP